jgi:phosphate transport system substrate-binding protein
VVISRWSKTKLLGVAVGVAALSLMAFTACGSDDDDDGDNGDTTPSASSTQASGNEYEDLAGDVVVDGSSTVGPLTSAVAEEFGKVSDVRVTVGISGTGGGFEKFCNGETDINDASREIKDEEAAACAAEGVEFVELKVAVDGLSVVVNPDNDWATCLTVTELKAIWDTGSTVNNWSQVRAGFPDQDLKLFGAGRDSGTFDYFTEAINGEAQQSRADYTASEDDNTTVQGVANDEGAMGYFGYSYFEENQDQLKALEIDGEEGGGCVAPTSETVLQNTYVPLSRPLFIYVTKEALAKPHVKGFVKYYLENVQALAEDVGFIQLPDADKTAGLAAID